MPKLPSVASEAERMVQVAEPFVYHVEGEPVDIGSSDTALTLERCVRLTLAHDPRIQASLARLRQAESDARQTRLLPNPVIGVAVRFPRDGGTSVIDADLSAELLSLLSRPGRISAVDHRLRKASSEALTTVLDVLAEVQLQYAEIQALRGRAEVEESRRTSLQQLASVTDARVRAGEAAKLDSLTAQATLATLETELLTLKSEERVARLSLARLIGLPSGPIDWSLATWSASPLPQLNESDWIALAFANRPELQAIQWELKALGQEVRLARLEPWTGELGVSGERDGEWSVGPSASVALPIFDNGSVARARREAMVTEQKHELVRTSRQVVQDVRSALERVRSAAEVLERTQRELIPLEEQRLKQAQDAYRIGLSDVLTIRLAEQDLQAARSSVVQMQSQLMRARFDLDRAVGGQGAYAASTTQPTTIPSENR